MKESVIVKSNKYGITLILNHEIEFEQLVKDICLKFMKSRSFFGEKEMIIALEGRELTSEETTCIVEAIELNSDIKITMVDEHDVLKDIRMKDKLDQYFYLETLKNAKIINHGLKKGETIESDSSIVILGDLKLGSTVKAAGNVIVVGCLEGDVIAGYPNEKNAYIVASELNTEKVTIGSISKEFEINRKWLKRTKNKEIEPFGIIVWNNNELLCEPLKSGIIKQIKV